MTIPFTPPPLGQRPRLHWGMWFLAVVPLVVVELALFPLGGFHRLANHEFHTDEDWIAFPQIASQLETAQAVDGAERPVVVIGSSSVYYGVSADVVGEELATRLQVDIPVQAYSSGNTHMSDALLLAHLLPAPPPRLLLAHAHPRDFETTSPPPDQTWAAQMLADGTVEWPTGYVPSRNRRLQLAVAQRWRTYRYRLLLQRMWMAEVRYRLGWYEPMAGDEMLMLAAFRNWRYARVQNWDPNLPNNWHTQALKDLATWARTHGVLFVVFSSPLCEDCNAYPLWLPEETRQLSAWLREQAPVVGFTYLDYSPDAVERRYGFRDFNHLNPAGQTAFSRDLADDLVSLLQHPAAWPPE